MKIDFFLFANEKWDFIKSNHVRETPSESKLLVHTFKFNCPIFLYLNEKKGGKNNIFDMNTNASTTNASTMLQLNPDKTKNVVTYRFWIEAMIPL